eukprot:PLAT1286.1.p2 GENE.PLAT1286.1~~PLAT1286.1.p2  ORF type:complete len:590 (-),score=272.05 PLAT1286.1:664-2433(-)
MARTLVVALCLLAAVLPAARAAESLCSVPSAFGGMREPQHSVRQWQRAVSNAAPEQRKCAFCHAFFSTADQMVYTGPVEDGVHDFGVQLCIALNLYDATVCEGVMHEFVAPLLKAESLHWLDPVTACNNLMPECPGQPALPFPKVEWSEHVQLKKPLTGEFYHITDVHFDPKYTVGTPAQCVEPTCCRKHDGKLTGPRLAGYWGDYGCDTAKPMVAHAFQSMKATRPDVDFVVWTGDDPPHNVWNQSREFNLNASLTVTGLLQEAMGDTQVFPALGNHEAFPVNMYHGNGQDAWLYDALADAWAQWLPEEALQTFRRFGYYTVRATEKLRMVALNSNYCIKENFWLKANHTDAEVELCWLERVLQMAREHDEVVYIYQHGPTSHDCFDFWGDAYLSLVRRFNDVIVGQFMGHTHDDSFVLYHDEAGLPINMAHVAPSITTHYNLNPSFRLMDYDTSSGAIQNYHQYRTNVTEANLLNEPQWRVAYSAVEHYGLPDYSAAAWQHVVAEEMYTNATFFNEWYTNFHSGQAGEWDAARRVELLCRTMCSTAGCTDNCKAHADICLPLPSNKACVAAGKKKGFFSPLTDWLSA